MNLEAKVLAIPAALALVACVLYVIFGQVTVRKLRKNPTTKDKLGLEFASGWDILNVASAISRPEWLNEKYKNSKLSFFAADKALLYQNTTGADRLLARLFWYTYLISGCGLILVLICSWLGVFN